MEVITEQILELVKKKMQEQGAYNKAAYKNLVDETIEYFKTKGKLTEDDNYEFIKDKLIALWPSVEDELAKIEI